MAYAGYKTVGLAKARGEIVAYFIQIVRAVHKLVYLN
jgi:hypothetical protein